MPKIASTASIRSHRSQQSVSHSYQVLFLVLVILTYPPAIQRIQFGDPAIERMERENHQEQCGNGKDQDQGPAGVRCQGLPFR